MKTEDLRICFIGDSFVNGTNDPECLGWTGRVVARAKSKGFPLTYYNLGIRRDTSRDIAGRWLSEASSRLPDNCTPFVVFSFGVNDMTIQEGRTRVPEAESIDNTRRILRAAKQRYTVALIGPPPIADEDQNERIHRLSNLFKEIATTESVPFLSLFETLRRDSIWMAEVSADDGAHPSAAGYSKLAALVEQWPEWWFK
jgi:lysophospholipase L1-like esterase